MGGNPSRDVHERVEEHAKSAIEGFYLLGQLLAMPELANKMTMQPPVPTPSNPIQAPQTFAPTFDSFSSGVGTFGSVAPSRLPLPNEAGFDLWCLTSPDARTKFSQDREAVRAVKMLWQLDPDPRRTLQIQAEINDAFARGDIALAQDRWGQRLGHFFCAPWGSVYVAKRSITLSGVRLNAMQQFIFNVTCEGVNLGVPFEREIMIGNFSPTSKFEYGDPNEAPDH